MRIAFAQRYSPSGLIRTEPFAPTGEETYYITRREWFDACLICGHVTAHPTKADADHAVATVCGCGFGIPAAPATAPGSKWTPEEDAVIVAVSDIDHAARQLPHRTRIAIRKRRLRLEAAGVPVTPLDHPYMPKTPTPRKAAS